MQLVRHSAGRGGIVFADAQCESVREAAAAGLSGQHSLANSVIEETQHVERWMGWHVERTRSGQRG